MSSLWRGDDHLVYVRGSGFLIPFTEEYKRYRFQDIQLISLAKKSRVGKAVLYSMVMMACAIPAILIFALSSDGLSTVGVVFSSIFLIGMLASLALLIRHLILGPTCTCDIQTGLSRDRIRPLDRFFRAKELVASLEQEIRESQKGLEAGATAAGKDRDGIEVMTAESNLAAALSVSPLAIPSFAATMVFALGCLAAVHLESAAICAFLFFFLLVLGVLMLANLVTSVRRATPESLRTVSWVLLGLLFLFIGFAVVYLLVAVSRDPAYTLGVEGPFEAFAAVATEGGLVFYIASLVLSAGLFAAGIAGLLQSMKWRGRIASGEHSAKTEEVENG